MSVSHSVHRGWGGGVCLSACWDTHTRRAGTPLLAGTSSWAGTPPAGTFPLDRYTSLGRYTPLRWSLQRTVRILLECFLVDTMRFKLTVKVKPRLLLKTDLGWIDLN